jgi:hypothetical protein
MGHQFVELACLPLGLPLLDRADHGVKEKHHEDEERVQKFADEQRNESRHEQQVDQGILELTEEDAERSERLGTGQHVGAKKP